MIDFYYFITMLVKTNWHRVYNRNRTIILQVSHDSFYSYPHFDWLWIENKTLSAWSLIAAKQKAPRIPLNARLLSSDWLIMIQEPPPWHKVYNIIMEHKFHLQRFESPKKRYEYPQTTLVFVSIRSQLFYRYKYK